MTATIARYSVLALFVVIYLTVRLHANVQVVSTCVLAITFIALILYTREMSIHNEMLIFPFIVLEYENPFFRVGNRGKGIALNINLVVENTTLPHPMLGFQHTVTYGVSQLDVLCPDQSVSRDIRIVSIPKGFDRKAALAHLGIYSNDDVDVVITFQNVKLQKYRCVWNTGKNGNFLKEPPKRV